MAWIETSTFKSTHSNMRDELKAQALDFGADLGVMGCYGHSRFRERILGGVAQHAERHAVPAAACKLRLCDATRRA